MSEFPTVQPDSEEHLGQTIRYCGEGPIRNTAMKFVVAAIYPGVVENPDLVVGHGGSEYEARADAFSRARKFIDQNR